MEDSVLLGLWHRTIPVPRVIWQNHVRGGRHLGFMSKDHHRVRNFVVRRLPRAGTPLQPESIAQALHLSVSRVTKILDELEQHMTFLFRNKQGAVAWAYPVTTDHTPHQVTLSTGEQIYAA